MKSDPAQDALPSLEAPRRDFGLRAIVGYKTAKACAQLGVGTVMVAAWPFGLARYVSQWADLLRAHFSHGLAERLADALARHATPRALAFVLVVLLLDGLFTGVEAWALTRGRAWGAWLVVFTTGSFLPFEVYELVRSPRLSRAVLLLINLAIVIYLARRVVREHRTRAASVD